MNLILDSDHNIVEIQGAAEHGTYSKKELDTLFALGEKSIDEIMKAQNEIFTDEERGLLK